MPTARSHVAPLQAGRFFHAPLGRGFTLVEVLTVMAIISLLTAITLPAVRGFGDRGKLARTRSELSLLSVALEDYRRCRGDYPQTGDFAEAPPETSEPLTRDHAQAKLFNALRGVLRPDCKEGQGNRSGSDFVDFARLATEFAPLSDRSANETNCLLDPWGRRYLYYYKRAGNPGVWGNTGYVLYSAGPDGCHVSPDLTGGKGGWESRTAEADADNVYADALTQ